MDGGFGQPAYTDMNAGYGAGAADQSFMPETTNLYAAPSAGYQV
jgi:hypothetical protein